MPTACCAAQRMGRRWICSRIQQLPHHGAVPSAARHTEGGGSLSLRQHPRSPSYIWGCAPRKTERAHPQNSEKPARNFEKMFLLKRKQQVSEISLDTHFGTMAWLPGAPAASSTSTASQQRYSLALLSSLGALQRNLRKVAQSIPRLLHLCIIWLHLVVRQDQDRYNNC